ncbi:MAG: sugar phosphate isomerase/epimerase [Bacteroidota bacterium]
MTNNRRQFLQNASMVAAGSLLLPHWACQSETKTAEKTTAPPATKAADPSLDKFGIQLYTLRDVIPQDPMGTIKQLASFGYQQIEGYEREQGLFWGMKNTEFKSFLDDLGMEMVASHCDIKKDFEQKAADAAEIGVKYLICPYIGPQESVENWKKVVDTFNECGEVCRKNGIKFAYHNHGYSFETSSGIIPHDFMMENTDPELVDYEMDIYWVVTADADPSAYLKKYANRFKLCHVKDRSKTAPADESNASVDLGTGTIDFSKILKVAKDNGMEYFIMEQERYDNSTSLESAKVGADYLSKLVFA